MKRLAAHISQLRKRTASNDLSSFYKADMDFLARIAILEGVAGVPVGTWVRRSDASPRNMRMIDQIKEKIPGLSPEWTDKGNSGMLPKSLQKLSRSIYNLPSEANMEDRVLSAIFGYVASGDLDKSLKFYLTGKDIASKVRNGAPPEVAIRWLSYTLYQFAVAYLRSHKKTENIMEEGEDGGEYIRPQVEDAFGAKPKRPIFDRVFDIITTPTDPLAVEFIKLMRESWKPTTEKGKVHEEIMEGWLKMVLRDMGVPSKTEAADELGIPVNNFDYHFKKWLENFSSLLAENPRLRDRLLDKASRRAKRKQNRGAVTARFEEGISVDVEQWLRDRGNHDAADDWAANTEKYKDKFKEASRSRKARFEEGTSVDVEQWLRDRGDNAAADEWAANTEKYKDKFKEASRRNLRASEKSARILKSALKELRALQDILDDADTLPPALSKYHTNDRLLDVVESLEALVEDVRKS